MDSIYRSTPGGHPEAKIEGPHQLQYQCPSSDKIIQARGVLSTRRRRSRAILRRRHKTPTRLGDRYGLIVDLNNDKGSRTLFTVGRINPKNTGECWGSPDGIFDTPDKKAGMQSTRIMTSGWSGNRGQWWGDVNGDNFPDLVYNRNRRKEYWVKLGTKDGTLEDATKSAGTRSHHHINLPSQWMVDINHDGKSDFVYEYKMVYYWMPGKDDGSFDKEKSMGNRLYDTYVSKFHTSQWWADVDGDRDPDLIYLSKPHKDEQGNQVKHPQFLVRINVEGVFEIPPSYEKWSDAPRNLDKLYTKVRFADMDQDGAKDLIYPLYPPNLNDYDKSPVYPVSPTPLTYLIKLSLVPDGLFGFLDPGTKVTLSNMSSGGIELADVNRDERLDMLYSIYPDGVRGSLSCVQTRPLTYDTDEQGYILDLSVGAKTIPFLLDTGSSNLLVPAADCLRCDADGTNCRPGCQGTAYVPSANANTACAAATSRKCAQVAGLTNFTISFGEGSTADATQTCDQVGLPDDPTRFPYAFGLVHKDLGGDVSSILGLGYRADAAGHIPPLLPCMAEQLGTRDVFELCLDRKRGNGHLRTGRTTLDVNQYTYLDIQQENNVYQEYNIKVHRLIASTTIVETIGDFPEQLALVDSGTSDMELPWDLYDKTIRYLRRVAQEHGIPVNNPFDPNDPDYPKLVLRPKQALALDLFPTLGIVSDQISLDLAPQIYWEDEGRLTYSIRISRNPDSTDNSTTLGLPFMENFYTLFDVSRVPNRIGFAKFDSSTMQCSTAIR